MDIGLSNFCPFIFFRAEIAQSAMPASSIIIYFDIFKYCLTHLISMYHRLIKHGFKLYGVEEALNASIVPTISFSTHALK